MRSLFQSRVAEPPVVIEPVRTVFPSMEGARIAAVFSGKRVAGDFYDALRANSQRVLIGLLDVAGRREDTRGILTLAQEIFRTKGEELLSKPDINESEAMTELCHLLNRAILDAEKGVRSCPGFLACYNEQLGTLCYANAGHTPGLVRDQKGLLELASTGLPLGLFSHATCEAPTVGLAPGAALLLVSRGLIESKRKRHRNGDAEVGFDRVKDLLRDNSSSDPQLLCTTILSTIEASEAGSAEANDQTALALIRMR